MNSPPEPKLKQPTIHNFEVASSNVSLIPFIILEIKSFEFCLLHATWTRQFRGCIFGQKKRRGLVLCHENTKKRQISKQKSHQIRSRRKNYPYYYEPPFHC